MKDEPETKQRHADETITLRKRIAELELREAGQQKTEAELRNALRKAEDEKSRSAAIIAAIGDGITIQDRDFKILFQNQIAVNQMGDHAAAPAWSL